MVPAEFRSIRRDRVSFEVQILALLTRWNQAAFGQSWLQQQEFLLAQRGAQIIQRGKTVVTPLDCKASASRKPLTSSTSELSNCALAVQTLILLPPGRAAT